MRRTSAATSAIVLAVAPAATRRAAIATASATTLAIARAVALAATPRAATAAASATTLVIALAIALAVAVASSPPALATEHEPYIDWTPAPVTAKPGQPPGYVQFQMSCAVCHGSGPGKPGTRALATKYKGATPALLEERTDLNATYIKQVVRQGLYVMPFFRKTELSDADLNAIVTYLTRKRP
jgi:mono/diheme cytochrome c family protein